MEEDHSKLVRAIHELKPQIDKLMFIGELANIASAGEFIPAGRITAGLTQVLLDVILGFERVYKHVPGAQLNYSLRCYEGSYHACCDHSEENPEVVHAWARRFETGLYIHSFVEIENQVYDYTINRLPHDRDDYYRTQGIEQVVARYALVEFLKLCVESGNYGPWDESLKN